MVAIVGPAAAQQGWGPHRSIETWLHGEQVLTLRTFDVRFEQFDGAAPAGDTQALYEIRNHATVRPFMPSPEPLALARHVAWVQDQLLVPGPSSPLILIGRTATRAPIGFGLLKPSAKIGAFEVGAMLVGDWQRSGLAPRLVAGLASIAAQLFDADMLLTHVHPAHERALRFNRAWGLMDAPSSDKAGELRLEAPITQLLQTPLYRRCARDLCIEISVKDAFSSKG